MPSSQAQAGTAGTATQDCNVSLHAASPWAGSEARRRSRLPREASLPRLGSPRPAETPNSKCAGPRIPKPPKMSPATQRQAPGKAVGGPGQPS